MSRNHVAWTGLAAACLAGLCLAQDAKPKPGRERQPRKANPSMQPTKQIVYKTAANADGAEVKLSLHVFEPPGHKASDRRPAIVFFFGGGWTGGSPEQFYPHAKYLAGRGMVAAAAEYRVQSRNQTTPFECVADGKSAIRYVRAHAGELGVDPNRIVASGGSAGGHVAASTGTLPGLDDPADDANVPARPDAMVLFNPVINCGPTGSYGHERVKERWQAICPTHNVSKHAPPAIVLHGKEDTTVRYADAEGFAKAMKAAGVRCELVGYDGQGHGFFNFGRAGNVNFTRTLEAADAFLASLGYVQGPPAVQAFVDQATAAPAGQPASAPAPTAR